MIQYGVLMLDRRRRALLPIALALAVSACAGRGGIPREPFADLPVPSSFVPYSGDWVRIRSDQADVARLIYMTPLDPDAAATAMRALLVQHGWTVLLANRTLTADGYKVTIVDFAKGADTVRATTREAANATHVELSVARVLRP